MPLGGLDKTMCLEAADHPDTGSDVLTTSKETICIARQEIRNGAKVLLHEGESATFLKRMGNIVFMRDGDGHVFACVDRWVEVVNRELQEQPSHGQAPLPRSEAA